MTQILLNIQDKQMSFFKELIKNFDFISVEKEYVSNELTEKQKDILEERLENYKNNPNSYLDSDEVRNNIKNSYDL